MFSIGGLITHVNSKYSGINLSHKFPADCFVVEAGPPSVTPAANCLSRGMGCQIVFQLICSLIYQVEALRVDYSKKKIRFEFVIGSRLKLMIFI